MEVPRTFECFICTMPVASGNCLSLLAKGLAKGKEGTSGKGKSNLQLLNTCFDRNVWSKETTLVNPLAFTHIDFRKVCFPCCRAIAKCEKSILELKNRLSTSSDAFQHFVANKVSVETTTEDLSTPSPTAENKLATKKSTVPKIPIKKRIKIALNTTRDKGVVYNTVRDEIHKEVVLFAKKSCLNNQHKVEDAPKNQQIMDEMKQWCPLTMSAMRGMFLKNCRKFKFSSTIRIAIGLAGYRQNQNCNGLQKSIALKLFNGQSKVETYEALQKMGLSTSYPTLRTFVGKKGKDFDEPLLDKKQGTEKIVKKKLKRKQCKTAVTKLPKLTGNEEDELMDIDENSIPIPINLPLQCSSSKKRKK